LRNFEISLTSRKNAIIVISIKVAAFSGYLQGDQTAAAKSVEEEE
jgi:hypothetical protein